MSTYCTECYGAIKDTVLRFEEKPFHKDCFVCYQCKKPLSGKSILKHNGHNYDQRCYANHHAKKCGGCGLPCGDPGVKYIISGGETFHPDCTDKKAAPSEQNCTYCSGKINKTVVKFEDNPYHPECFVCSQCRQPLSGKSIRQHNGRNYDSDCYASFHAKKCGGCKKPCSEVNVKFVIYEEETYHPECFSCHKCGASLQGKQFYNSDHGKTCEQCHA